MGHISGVTRANSNNSSSNSSSNNEQASLLAGELDREPDYVYMPYISTVAT